MKAIDIGHRVFKAVKHTTSHLARAYLGSTDQVAQILEALDSVARVSSLNSMDI
jgi:hypothetical protein